MNQRSGVIVLLTIGLIPLELNGFYHRYLSRFPGYFWLEQTVSWVFFPLLVYLLGIRKYFSNDALGFHLRIFNKKSLLSFVICLIVVWLLTPKIYALCLIYAQRLFPVNFWSIPFTYNEMVPSSGIGRGLAIAYMAITAGVVEEFYFKGMFKFLFSKNFVGNFAYVFFSALAFSSIHWEGGIAKLFATFLLGCVTSAIYVFLGNIWPLIAGHVFTDILWLSWFSPK